MLNAPAGTGGSDLCVPLAYLVFFTPRSGSYLLCSELQASNVAGRPGEWFSPTTASSRGAAQQGAIRRLANVVGDTATANGVVGAKTTRFHYESFSECLSSELGGADLDLLDALSVVGAEVRLVWLRRRDKARQAVSYWRASVTGEWSLRPGQAPGGVESSRFDVEHAARLEERIVTDERWIAQLLARSQLPHTIVWYEDLAAHPRSVTDSVLTFLGVQTPSRDHQPRFSRQSDATSESLVERYVSWRTSRLTSPEGGRRTPGPSP